MLVCMCADKEKLNYQLWIKLDGYLQLSSIEESGWWKEVGIRHFPKMVFKSYFMVTSAL